MIFWALFLSSGVDMVIDDIDAEILRALTTDGRMTYRELGEAIGLSSTAAAARVERLVTAGIIEGFGAKINRGALGDALHVFIDIKFTQSAGHAGFFDLIQEMGQIESARHITGPFDCAIDAWVASSEELATLLGRLKATGDVAESQTRLVLNSLKG